MYFNGIGVAQDYSAAMKWFEWLQTKEMHKGSLISGSCTKGHGVAQDYAAAMVVSNGSRPRIAEAQCSLGLMYFNGQEWLRIILRR